MFFLRDYALPVTLTFDVRMNNALRAAMITWFQQLPAIVVTLLSRDPLSRFYTYLWLPLVEIATHLQYAVNTDSGIDVIIGACAATAYCALSIAAHVIVTRCSHEAEEEESFIWLIHS